MSAREKGISSTIFIDLQRLPRDYKDLAIIDASNTFIR